MHGFRELDAVIEYADGALREHPEMSATELLGELRALRSRLERGVEHATCRHCGHPIYYLGGRWQHGGESGNVSCRAASYDRLGTWDDALNRSWRASPAKTAH
jgi:hypothetical protein